MYKLKRLHCAFLQKDPLQDNRSGSLSFDRLTYLAFLATTAAAARATGITARAIGALPVGGF